MRATLRGAPAAGIGIALVVLGLGRAGSVLGWCQVCLGATLASAGCLAPYWPGAWRWLGAILLAQALLWVRHLNYAAVAALPVGISGPWVVLGALWLVVAVAGARTARWRALWAVLRASPARLSLLAVGWLYVTARWFNRAEWIGGRADVVRGLWPLVSTPLGLVALVAAARALPADALAAFRRAWRRGWQAHETRLVIALAVAVFALTGVLTWCCIGPLPHVEDEIAYLHQAKTFCAGGFRTPAPPVPGAFDATFAWVFIDDGGWSYGIFPPGWPLLLAVGVVVGCPWLVNPLLTALAVWLFYRLVRAADAPSAGWATLLFAGSPFLILMGTSFLAHPATLLWILVALGGAVRIEGGRAADAAAVGLGIGLTIATRYVEGLLLGLVLAGWFVARRVSWRAWAYGLLALLPGLGLALADNAAKTGSPFVTPVERWYTVHEGAPINRPGFGPHQGLEWDHSLGPGHSLVEGLWNTNANLFELNRYALGWASGSLLLALLFVLYGRLSPTDRLLGAYALGLLAVYTAYWYHGIAFGPRFLHPLLIPLALYTVKGARWVVRRLGVDPHDMERLRDRLLGLALCGALTAWLAFAPLELLTTYRNHRGRDASERSVLTRAKNLADGRPAVIVQHMTQTGGTVEPDYGIGFSLNPPGFRGDALVARELDPEGRSQLAAIRAAWPERVILMWYKPAGKADLRVIQRGGEPRATRER